MWLFMGMPLLTIAADFGTKAYIPPDEPAFDAGPGNHGSSTTGAPPPPPPSIPVNFEGGIFSINHYKRYFNINTSEFIQNFINSLNVLKKVENEEELGDMYGPVWVSATVIFTLFFSNTSSNLLVSWFSGVEEKYQYDFRLLTGAISIVYAYTFLIPIVFYGISVFYFKLTGFLTLSKIISIYGYANSAWLPAALLSILRGLLVNHHILSNILKWVSVLAGGLISAAAIFAKVYPNLKNSTLAQDNEKLSAILIGALALAHLGFIIAVKVLFFGDLKVVN
jgi:hypothetical protein